MTEKKEVLIPRGEAFTYEQIANSIFLIGGEEYSFDKGYLIPDESFVIQDIKFKEEGIRERLLITLTVLMYEDGKEEKTPLFMGNTMSIKDDEGEGAYDRALNTTKKLIKRKFLNAIAKNKFTVNDKDGNIKTQYNIDYNRLGELEFITDYSKPLPSKSAKLVKKAMRNWEAIANNKDK